MTHNKSVPSESARAALTRFPERFGEKSFADDIPPWMQRDPYIRNGYRAELKSVDECIRSLFYSHNETVNAWSHLLPALVHSVVLATEIVSIVGWESGKNNDHGAVSIMVQLYEVSVIVCLTLSSMYHVFNAYSEPVARAVLKLDYLGIVVNVAAASVTFTWFGLRDEPQLRNVYIIFIVSLTAVVFVLLLAPAADGPTATRRRIQTIALLVCSGYAPMVYEYPREGIRGLQKFPLKAAAIMATSQCVGIAFYITRFPECVCPGIFDIWVSYSGVQGSSHQVFHIFVVFGQVIYLRGLRNLISE
ncbi:hypothetical protein K491DRAFT_612403 [Lophiostoma macrostomum CBS 122681]|uniref:HlyIII-domain-containing protein n=1 Tax=Lophiostoma macrostomum CBS 122681 TaxID=1314788 RepID=A0A6A6SNQ8_9PLEO|nr:hypothetical protein K491DRAFT_612403 [Lophiostoma macrostomum CBS 122681]